MRWWWVLAGLLLLSGVSAQEQADRSGTGLEPGALGTRTSSPLTPAGGSAPVGASNLLQMVTALGIVAILLRYGLPKLLRWGAKGGFGSRLDGEIRILESRAVPGGAIHLVRVRERVLLIGSTPQSLHLLADLTESPLTTPLSPLTAFESSLQQADRKIATSSLDERAALLENLHLATERLKQMATSGEQ